MKRAIVVALIALITALAILLAWGYWTAFRMVRGFLRMTLSTGPPRRF